MNGRDSQWPRVGSGDGEGVYTPGLFVACICRSTRGCRLASTFFGPPASSTGTPVTHLLRMKETRKTHRQTKRYIYEP